MRITLVLSLIIAILAVVFALQNPAPIEVALGPFDVQGSTALILLATFSIGVVVGILATVPSVMKRRKQVKELKHHPSDTGSSYAPPESDIHTSSKEYRTE